jgi:hypothetical protein
MVNGDGRVIKMMVVMWIYSLQTPGYLYYTRNINPTDQSPSRWLLSLSLFHATSAWSDPHPEWPKSASLRAIFAAWMH